MDKCKSGKSLSCKVQILAHGFKKLKREEEKDENNKKRQKRKDFRKLNNRNCIYNRKQRAMFEGTG